MEKVEKKNVRLSAEQVALQKQYMKQVKAFGGGLARVITYGCQQNENDSERLAGMLMEMGYELTEDNEKANIILFNTCAVREGAELKVYGNVGALKAMAARRDDLLVGVCGCMMQQQSVADRIKAKYRHVGLVFGTHSLFRFPELLYHALAEKERVFDVEQSDGHIAEELPVYHAGDASAWVSVMYGCNNFCTYCIVPHVRGRERSRLPEDVLSEVRGLAARGVREITLLGQNVNSYGKDLESAMDFADLLEAVNGVEGIRRIRFMTSHPKDMTDKLIDTMARCGKVCKYLHLPFQAGNDRVLKEMNRRYTKKQYLELVGRIKARMPGVALTSDVIVGFPGETKEEFEDTIDVLEQVRFDSIFSFVFSPRPGTPAANMDDPVSHEEKQENFNRLLAVQNRISAEINRTYQDTVQPVMVEGPSKTDPDMLTGRTETNKIVNFKNQGARPGEFLPVRITKCQTWSLTGEVEQQ